MHYGAFGKQENLQDSVLPDFRVDPGLELKSIGSRQLPSE